PKKSNISIEVLKKEREDLRELLNEKQKDRSNIEENIKQRLTMKEKYEKQLDNEINIAKYPIDQDFNFPIYGEEEIGKLIKDINNITPKVNRMKKKLDKKEEKYKSTKTEYNLREKDFFKTYDKIVEFTEPLSLVEEKNNKNRQELNGRYKYLKSMEEKLNKEYDSVKNALNLLKKKNERFDYLINKIEPETLSENIITELPYNREKYITTLLDKLESLGYKVENREYKVSREKTSFEAFCNQF